MTNLPMKIRQTIVPVIQRLVMTTLNRQRMTVDELDYVLITLPSQMAAFPEPRGFIQRRLFGEPDMSLTELERAFRRIAEDPRPQGVILYLRGLQMPLADLQTLRSSMLRLRRKGKRIICYAQNYDTTAYYIASAADEILLQPSGDLTTLGIRAEPVFIKDALERIGVQVEAVQITPYKSAPDVYARSDISPEAEEQLNWLLDSRYEMIVNGIAEEREMEPDAVREMIDTAPHIDRAALEAGYVDAILNEEGLSRHLGVEHIVPWRKAQRLLIETWRGAAQKYVALIRIGGLIIPGESRQPPNNVPVPLVGGEAAGDITVVQNIRQVMADERAAAVIVYVDSGGGSAAASEAMTAALAELAKSRPVVAYMNNVAASGGYYVVTPARWIVAQPGTITGSIGVLTAKPTTQDAYEKLNINRIAFSRGANTSYMSDFAPYTDQQREQAWAMINSIYDQFIGRVADSRNMSEESVKDIAGGRVWTGVQAYENGLVDQLGDLQAAFDKAKSLARLPEGTPLILTRAKINNPLAPQVNEKINPAAPLGHIQRNLKSVFSGRAQMLIPFTLD